MAKEFVTGLIALVLAAIYYAAASDLPISMLSDKVGDDGVPKALAVALALVGAIQIVRALLSWRSAAENPPSGAVRGLRPHLAALGLLLIAVAYVAVTPYLGYLPATAALIYAVAAYAGQAHSLRLAAISLGGGFVLWLSFAKLLGIGMPAGVLGRLIG